MLQILKHHGSQVINGQRTAQSMAQDLAPQPLLFSGAKNVEPQNRKPPRSALGDLVKLVGAEDIYVIANPVEYSDWTVVHAGPQCVEAGVNAQILAMLPISNGPGGYWLQSPNPDCRHSLLVSRLRGLSGAHFIVALMFNVQDANQQADAVAAYDEASALLCSLVELTFHAWQLQNKVQGLHGALDCADAGVILLNVNGGIVHENGIAERLLDRGAGLRRCGQSVAATDTTDAIRFRMGIERAMTSGLHSGKTPAAMLALKRGKGHRPLLACLIPADASVDYGNGVSLIIFLYDPERKIAHLLRSACQLYRLAPVETELSCRLACGESVADAAAALRIKDLTARGYLKQIFVKTGVNRQAALVQLLLSSTVHLGDDIELMVI